MMTFSLVSFLLSITITGIFSSLSSVLREFPVYPPAGYTAVASPPRLRIALATLMPPPPGSNLAMLQRSFFSGMSFGIDALLSMQGEKVRVKMWDIGCKFKVGKIVDR